MPKIVILSSLGALVVGAAAIFLLLGGDAKEEVVVDVPVEVKKQEEKKQEPTKGTASLEYLMSLAQNLECNISYEGVAGANQNISGTYFTSRGMMRGDFIVPDLATGSVSSMIMKDNMMYSWTEIEGQSYGVKIDMAAYEEAKTAGKAPDTKNPVPLDVSLNYECKPWTTVDGSIFEAPKDILFRDFSDVVSTGMEFGTVYTESSSDNSAQCALCDQVAEGEGKNECKATFKCQ